jgi:hypothetical protein
MIFSIAQQTQITGSTPGKITFRQLAILESLLGYAVTAETPRFTAIRVKQLMVWGPEDGKGALTVALFGTSNNVTLYDDASFRAFGIPGSRRAALNIRPNLLARNQWMDTGNSTEGTATSFSVNVVDTSSEDALSSCVVRVTMEMR